MEKQQLIFFICFASLLLVLLLGFLFFVLLVQRRKSNRFIRERERLKTEFNEQLLRSQLEIQDQSFNSISMEIHDNVGQTLSLLNVQLNIIEQKQPLDKIMITEAKESAKKAMNDLRDIAKGLNSDRIQSCGLPEVIQQELHRINRTGHVQIAFQLSGKEQAIQGQKKVILFRIIQECLQNIINHSGAKTASVQFSYFQNHLVIEISDNGKGFDPASTLNMPGQGIGLQNLIKRAAVVNGHARIESAPNKGTTISITCPYE